MNDSIGWLLLFVYIAGVATGGLFESLRCKYKTARLLIDIAASHKGNGRS